MILNKNKFLFIIIFIILFFAGCLNNKEKAESGIIRNCSFTMGEERCGKCYCLETEEKGCEIIDYSSVGDLAFFVNKKVKCDLTRNQSTIQSTRMCPKQVKLFKIRLSK
jgi:hypothetical protein